MKLLASVKNQKLRLYLLISLAFFCLLELIVFFSGDGSFLQRTVNHIWLIPYLALNHYVLYEKTIPFIQRNYIRLLLLPLLIPAHMIFYTIGIYAWRKLGILLHTFFEIQQFKTIEEGLEYYTGFSIGSVLFFGITRHVYYYTRLKQSAQQLQIEKQKAELNYLKAQTNPHFLFNTLNNIYSLARDKNDLAPESILRLSKILRYMLYETNGSFIAVEQELKIISDYLALEQLRYDESLHINFNHNIEDTKQALPPLLLMPLVENAFKHGVSETRSKPFVEIHLSIQNRQLRFEVKNSTGFAAAEEVKENIGLSNLRRQLELQYKEYRLETTRTDNTFTAILTIHLNSHVST